jgi:hypothetical protein
MALHGLGRLLRRRRHGPAQLATPLAAMEAGIAPLRSALADLVEWVAGRADGASHAAEILASAADRIGADIESTFGTTERLAARRRLRLERDAERLGAGLEALGHWLAVAHAAVAPRSVALAWRDMLLAPPRVTPIFTRQSVAVHLGGTPGSWTGEPRVAWALVEHALRRLHAEGGARAPRVELRAAGTSPRLGLRLALVHGTAPSETIAVPLGAALPEDAALASAMAEQAHAEIVHEAGAVVLTLG